MIKDFNDYRQRMNDVKLLPPSSYLLSPIFYLFLLMNFYSTKDKSVRIPFQEAIFMGPAADGGLFMPLEIPPIYKDRLQELSQENIADTGVEIIKPFVEMDELSLRNIIKDAFNFTCPVNHIKKDLSILELFHGPTLAFKDYGARFMARCMSYYKPRNTEINILVATSGDTGGAVASAFSGLPGFTVYILFPKGKVSAYQQRQLTTWEGNIKAIEVNGTFDDCQKLVKTAFADTNLRTKNTIGSANSINIARLLPQMIYYFEAYKQARDKHDLNFIVPSGNFGNLTAGLIAKRMGLDISHFIAATNANDIVPIYLTSGSYIPRVSRETLSNAMDVGDPSNFARMLDLYSGDSDKMTLENMRKDISHHVVSDDQTLYNIREVYDLYGYIMDPHTAVAYEASKKYPGNNIIVSTAHWAKFANTIENALGFLPTMPKALTDLLEKEEKMDKIGVEYGELLEVIG